LAEVLKTQGYATGHFGKNHLGNQNVHLPTNHGFDEFFGNLYHLNTQEEAEQRDFKAVANKSEGGINAYKKKFETRNVLHSYATTSDDATIDPRFGKVGKQKITDEGPLTQERMKLFDSAEVAPKAFDFMLRSKKQGKPFFVWLNTSRMHLYTRLADHWRYAAEQYTSEADFHGSGMLQHDADVKAILDFLDKNGLAENTVVWYSTDNGPEHKEDYYANVVPLTAPLFFNIRMDPNESYDGEGAQHLLQKTSWLLAPMGEKINAHIKTLMDFPPVQGSKSFDMSNIMESIKKPLQ